ncbi:uncharacterized protein LOC130995992 [Salvia miltiorrhiza]|uniref:uncharacterized protein LOC130995992 n=1 Tax=Salvia miltiorrhiza TaxID=226208 RepID=UPI0025AC930C|nr:uncharacterized protein LOC130995992 [Salvia miltiorrhiza]
MTAESTDSSGELFSEARWVSDASERNLRRDKEGNGGGEREFVISGYGLVSNCDIEGNESGYGSDSGYKGDVELEYGDELDVEEDDGRSLFGAMNVERILHNWKWSVEISAKKATTAAGVRSKI